VGERTRGGKCKQPRRRSAGGAVVGGCRDDCCAHAPEWGGGGAKGAAKAWSRPRGTGHERTSYGRRRSPGQVATRHAGRRHERDGGGEKRSMDPRGQTVVAAFPGGQLVWNAQQAQTVFKVSLDVNTSREWGTAGHPPHPANRLDDDSCRIHTNWRVAPRLLGMRWPSWARPPQRPQVHPPTTPTIVTPNQPPLSSHQPCE